MIRTILSDITELAALGAFLCGIYCLSQWVI